jgi:hypothetical protein
LLLKITQSFLLEVKIYQFFQLSNFFLSVNNTNTAIKF